MADKTIIRELVTLFGFESDEKKLDKIDKAVKQVKTRLREAARAATYFGATVGLLVRNTITQGSELIATSRKLKISTDALQEWRYAGQSAGIELGTINSSLESFSRRIGEAARGQGPAIEALGRLGISVRDSAGEIRSIDALLAEAMVSLDGFAEGQERTELATKLFGATGSDMVLMLENGVDGLRRLRQEAHASGAVISRDLAMKGKEASQEWLKFTSVLNGFAVTVGASLLPHMTMITSAISDWIGKNQQAAITLTNIGIAILALRIPLALLGAKLALIAGLTAGFFLLFEDIGQGLAGNTKSLTGQLLLGLNDLMVRLWADAKVVIAKAWDYMYRRAREFYNEIATWPKKLTDKIEGIYRDNPILNVLFPIKKIVDTRNNPFYKQIADEKARSFGAEQQAIAFDPNRLSGGMFNITVNAAPGQTPTGIAAEVASKLSGQRVMMNDSMMGALAP